MNVYDNVLDLIGNTPLIRLKRASEATGCKILGKAEFMNPGQSVKDRAALCIIRDAIAAAACSSPGGVIVEGTAGNTGIGLALVANALGFRTVIVIPETQSQEKKDTLRSLGAELVEVPAVPYRNPNNYVKVSGRLAERLAASEPNGAIWANQFDNVANRQAHIDTTGPEIWEQTGGQGRRLHLRGRHRRHAGRRGDRACANATRTSRSASPTRPARRSITTTPPASSRPRAARSPKASARAGSPPTSKASRSTTPSRSPTRKRSPACFDLLEHEGLCLGRSSGINVAGAIRLARELGPGKTIVTILCDYGTRYQSKLFNPDFLRSKGLPVPSWLDRTTHAQPDFVEVETA